MPFSDISEYLTVFDEIKSIEIGSYSRFGAGIEFTLLLLMKFSNFLVPNNQFFFLIMTYTCIQVCVFFISYKMHKSLYLLIYLTFNISIGFLEFNSILLRNSLASVFFILGFLCVGKSKILFYLFSLFSHLSISLYLGVVFVKRYFRFNVIGLSVLIILISFFLVGFSFSAFEYIFVKVSLAITTEYPSQKLGYIFLTGVNLLIIFYSIMKTLRLNKQQNKSIDEFKSILWLLFVSAILFFGTSFNINLSTRLGFLCFSYMAFFFQPFLNSIFISKHQKVFVVTIYLLINCIPFLYSMWNVSHGMNQFTFLNQQPVTYSYTKLLADSINKFSRDSLPSKDSGNK
jgi:hypothetical protein